MIFTNRQKALAIVSATVLWCLTIAPAAQAQAPAAAARLEEQARDLSAKGAQARVTLTTGRTLRGQIVRVERETLVLRPKGGADETVQYAMVKRIQKQGGVRKAILIPAIVGGAALVLCAAPYPIGFLCRRDPS
jgi:hypothetical protein